MKKTGLLLLLLLCVVPLAAQTGETALLQRLDEVLARQDGYAREKATEIAQLRETLPGATSGRQQYAVLRQLYEAYNSRNADSARAVVREMEHLAQRTGNSAYRLTASLYAAEIQSKAGMFKEALDLINAIDRSSLPPDLIPYYYHIYRSLYGFMAEYALSPAQIDSYLALADTYRDSILLVNPPGSAVHTIVKADQMNARNQPGQAVENLVAYLGKHPEAIQNPQFTYTLSEAYRLQNEVQKRKELLLQSAIADAESANKEYISLRELAVLLYREGDIDRAYRYMKQCIDDASVYNARLRLIEILKMFPVINQTYQDKTAAQQKKMRGLLAGISVLALFLLFAIFYVYKQHKQVVCINRQLKKLNYQMHEANEKLKEANRSLAENAYIKEAYIGRYIDQCSVYIEKMEEYRHTLNGIAAKGGVKELIAKIKSTQFIDDELKEFYANFDETFLHLFPSFVEDFNALLAPGEQMPLSSKEQGRLNTELRIFALIRLGITDSVKIAQFLRYSVRTIYNYRTKMRNKAAGNRDAFEKEVMKIGKPAE